MTAFTCSGVTSNHSTIESMVASGHGQAPGAVLARLLDAVRAFTEGAPQADDLTVVVLRFTGPAPASA